MTGLTLLTGCTMTTSGPPNPPAVQRVLDAGEVTWDLRTPPSRSELGLRGEENVFIYEYNDANRTINVTLLLPRGETFHKPATSIILQTQNDSPHAPPVMVKSIVYEDTPTTAADRMTEVVQQLGLSPAAVDEWVSATQRADENTVDVESVWMSASIGYVTAEMQGEYAPPLSGYPDSDSTTVRYQFSWFDI